MNTETHDAASLAASLPGIIGLIFGAMLRYFWCTIASGLSFDALSPKSVRIAVRCCQPSATIDSRPGNRAVSQKGCPAIRFLPSVFLAGEICRQQQAGLWHRHP